MLRSTGWQPEGDVDRGAGRRAVELHGVAEGPHQHQAPPAVDRGGRLPRTGVADPRAHRAVTDAGIKPQPADAVFAVCVLDAVGARLVDDQHDVGDQPVRDVRGPQPRRPSPGARLAWLSRRGC